MSWTTYKIVDTITEEIIYIGVQGTLKKEENVIYI